MSQVPDKHVCPILSGDGGGVDEDGGRMGEYEGEETG